MSFWSSLFSLQPVVVAAEDKYPYTEQSTLPSEGLPSNRDKSKVDHYKRITELLDKLIETGYRNSTQEMKKIAPCELVAAVIEARSYGDAKSVIKANYDYYNNFHYVGLRMSGNQEFLHQFEELKERAFEEHANPVEVAYLNCGKIKLECGYVASAIADFTKAIHFKPEYADAYYHRGLAEVQLKKYDEAVADFTRAIELDPTDKMSYKNRAMTQGNFQNKNMEAMEDFSKAIELDPYYADAYEGLGIYKYILGDKNAAKAAFLKVKEIDRIYNFDDVAKHIMTHEGW